MSAESLRKRILDDELLVTPGVFDTLSSRIAASVGFETVILGGYAAGASTGMTEPMMTMTDMCARAREITHNTDVALVVDGDAGFGNPSHTYRTVQEYAKSGIAGVHIEDLVYPKRMHYHDDIVHITDEAEMVTKVRAAAQAKTEMDEDIVLIARSDAGRKQRRRENDEGIEDAVGRMNAYLDAGAEVGIVFPQSLDELKYATDNVDGPLLFPVIENYEPCPSTEELQSIGVNWCCFPIAPSVVTANGLLNLYSKIEAEGQTGLDPDEFAAARNRIEEYIDLPKYYDIERRAGNK